MTQKQSEMSPEILAKHLASTSAYRARTSDHRRAYNSKYHSARYAADPAYRARRDEGARKARLKALYNLTDEERLAMLEAQGGVCAVCRKGANTWHTDHCHKTQKVRGILCPGCNVFIGKIEKDEVRHQRALAYIEEHKT